MKIFQVDSFTREKFKGNPAGVCISEEPLAEELMQQIAAEMNLAETAFVNTAQGYQHLRWFTPTSEVDLCGHATLATAHILFEQRYFGRNEALLFHTRSGTLEVVLDSEGSLRMDFPLIPSQSAEVPDFASKLFEGITGFASTEKNDIIELSSAEGVVKARPDMTLLSRSSRQGIIITARGEGEWASYDFISRYFAPNVGVPEDPVTGSAHCELAAYWQEKMQKNMFKAYQASARGGSLKVEIAGSRVFLTGDAVTVFGTSLHL